ncbi:MAG: hypothetical protein ABW133_18180 [Polyangiaceae bacterium]
MPLHLARLAWQRTLAAFGLNILGMPLEMVMRRSIPGIPMWPSLGSMSISAFLLVLLVRRRDRSTVRFASALFLLHNVGIVSALWITSGYFSMGSGSWVPLQAFKLGALIVAALAPEPRWSGFLSIAMFIGAAFAKVWILAETPALVSLVVLEVWTIVIFGLFALLLLLHRARSDRLRDDLVDAQAKSQALGSLAHRLLAIADLANSPLQVLELNVPLLDSATPREAIRRIERAIGTLRSWHRLLDREAVQLRWTPDWESFDAQATLREDIDVAKKVGDFPADSTSRGPLESDGDGETS